MSYSDMSDFTPELTAVFPGDVTVFVQKAGGGTPGKKYGGMWWYRVEKDIPVEGLRVIAEGKDFHTGSGWDHLRVATSLEFMARDRE